MNKIKKKIRLLPIIGITLTLIGYFFLVFQTFKLNERKISLKNEIKSLEGIKSRLINEVKERDTLISIQDNIISQSTDQKTVDKGIELKNRIKKSEPDYFIVTKKNDANIELAKKFEIEGYNYLFEKDINKAILSFKKSENSFNGYHQVYEIAIYLNKNRDLLIDKNSKDWKNVFQKILNDYSWKIPDEVRVKLERYNKI